MKKKILLIALLILLVTSIKAQYTVGVSYYGDSSWIEYIPGNMPIIIVAPLCLSTIESVYTVLNLLKEGNLEHCDTKDFLLPFEKMVDYQVKCMLDPSTQNYRPYTKSELTPKNQYKKNTQRNIVFELDK
jgi:hypothetical protein